MKNIAVFCRNRGQFMKYLAETTGASSNSIYWSWMIKISLGDYNYFYMNEVSKVDYIRGIRWDGIVHLPEYKQQPDLIEQVMFNLRGTPKKSKRETLIEELESKLAEVQARIEDLKREE